MRRVARMAVLLIVLIVFAAASPSPSERKAVLDALRPKVETKLGPGIEFVVQIIRVENGWAFVMADPQRKGGKAIDGHRIFDDDFENMDACGSMRCCGSAEAAGWWRTMRSARPTSGTVTSARRP